MKHFYWDVLFLVLLFARMGEEGEGFDLIFVEWDLWRMRTFRDRRLYWIIENCDDDSRAWAFIPISAPSLLVWFSESLVQIMKFCGVRLQPQIISASNLKYKYRQAEERHCRRHSLKSFALHKYVFLGFDASLLAIEFCSFSRFNSLLGVIGTENIWQTDAMAFANNSNNKIINYIAFLSQPLLLRQKHKVKNMSRLPPHFQIESHTWSPTFFAQWFLDDEANTNASKMILMSQNDGYLIEDFVFIDPASSALYFASLLLPATFLFQSLSIPSRHF